MAKLAVKAGVQPQLVHILAALANVAQGKATSDGFVWITAGIDGVHSFNSLHYALRAVDVRVHNMANPSEFVSALKAELGPDYDVLLESPDKPAAHIHIEFDPKH